MQWSTVIADEAQTIKNPSTHAAKAIRALTADQKLALTGTPVENRLADLWAILDAVNPGMLGSRERFRHRFAKPIERDGDGEAAARLRRITQPFVLRRSKADRQLVPDLPEKIEQVAWAGLTREQAVLYQHVVDQLLADAAATTGMKRRGLVLAALTRLKQICNHPAHALGDGSRLSGRSGKLARFDELVDELLDIGERALVFTQFRQMGDLLVHHVAERFEMRVPFLHGGVSKGRRDRMVADFQAGAGPPLLLISLKAGGTGLNLTAASQVIHYDRWWNPAVEDQATDRAWRIGQGRTVVVHKLVCEGTVEERIAALDRPEAGAGRRRRRCRRGVAVGAVDRRAARPRPSGRRHHEPASPGLRVEPARPAAGGDAARPCRRGLRSGTLLAGQAVRTRRSGRRHRHRAGFGARDGAGLARTSPTSQSSTSRRPTTPPACSASSPTATS